MKAARKDSAVHVSLSSDLPVKRPGTMAVPPSEVGEPPKHPASDFLIGCPVTLISEELRRRVITPRRAARRSDPYIGFGPWYCQPHKGEICPPRGSNSAAR